MPLLIEKNRDRLTVAQQKEIVTRLNDSYDKGGADTLKLVAEAANQVAEDHPELAPHVSFTLHLVEVLRAKLQEALENAHNEPLPEEKQMIIGLG